VVDPDWDADVIDLEKPHAAGVPQHGALDHL